MIRNTHTLEDTIYAFRRTATDRVRRNIAEEMQAAKSSSRYQSAFPYYAMLQNTDHMHCLTLQQIDEIIRAGKQNLLEEKSIFGKAVNVFTSFFGKNTSSAISDAVDALAKYHTLEKKVVASLTKTRTALVEATHDYVQNDLQSRIVRLEKQQTRIGADVISGNKNTLTTYIFQQRGYISGKCEMSNYSVTTTEQRVPRFSVINTVPPLQPISPKRERQPSYFRRFTVAAASLTTVAVAGCLAYFTLPGYSSEASPRSFSSSVYTPSSGVHLENPPLSSPVIAPSPGPLVSYQPEIAQKPEPKIYGYAPGASEFLQPTDVERRSVIATIDSWNGTTSVSLRGLSASHLQNGIYRVEKRAGYVDFLFVENNVVKGTGSYEVRQPRVTSSS